MPRHPPLAGAGLDRRDETGRDRVDEIINVHAVASVRMRAPKRARPYRGVNNALPPRRTAGPRHDQAPACVQRPTSAGSGICLELTNGGERGPCCGELGSRSRDETRRARCSDDAYVSSSSTPPSLPRTRGRAPMQDSRGPSYGRAWHNGGDRLRSHSADAGWSTVLWSRCVACCSRRWCR